METIILYPSGRTIEAAVLAVGRYCMRVVPRDSDDAIELRLEWGQWYDEAGDPIEFGSFIAGGQVDLCGIGEEMRPLVSTASQ